MRPLITFLLLLFVLPAHALELTYNGRLLETDGDPATNVNIFVRFDIKTAVNVGPAACYLYQYRQGSMGSETHINNTQTDADGVFSVVLDDAQPRFNQPGGLERVFDGSQPRTCFDESGVATGQTIAAGSYPVIQILVYFKMDNADGWDEIDAQTMRPTVEAVNAQKLAGKPITNFIQVDGAANQTNFANFFQGTNFGKLSNYASGGALDLGGGGLTNVANPIAGTDAVNRNYADSLIATALLRSGGTMSGAIDMGAQRIVNLGAPAATGDAATKLYVDTRIGSTLPLTGGTISGALNMGGQQITNLGEPGATGAAATKNYVDTEATKKLSLTGGTMSGAIDMADFSLANSGHIVMANDKFISVGRSAGNPSTLTNAYVGALWFDNTNDILKYQAGTGVIRPVSSLVAVTGVFPVSVNTASYEVGISIANATNSSVGVVQLAANNESNGARALASNDARLTNSRAPTGTATGDLAGDYPAPTVTKIRGYSFNAGAPSTGMVPKFNLTEWVPSYFDYTQIRNSASGVQQIPTGGCSASQVLTWDAGSGAFVCSNISILLAQISDRGTAAGKNFGVAAGNLVELNGAARIDSGLLEQAVVRATGNSTGSSMTIGSNDAQDVSLVTSGHARISVLNTGFVGINKAAPSERLEVDGNILASGSVRGQTLVTTSDGRLKKNVRGVEGLALILKLQGHRFTWKTDDREDIGFIAQEVEAVDPDLVVTSEDGTKGVKYANVVAPLVESTKELYGLCQMAKSQTERLQREWAEKFSRLEGERRADRAQLDAMTDKVRRLEDDNQQLRRDVDELKETLKRLAR